MNIIKIKPEDIKNVFANKTVIIINDTLYDVTSFKNDHPGGKEVLEELMYGDATDSFNDIGHSTNAKGLMKQYIVGFVDRSNNDNTQVTDSEEADSNLGINSCSGFSEDIKQIKKNVIFMMSSVLGFAIFLISYLVSLSIPISSAITAVIMAFMLSHYYD